MYAKDCSEYISNAIVRKHNKSNAVDRYVSADFLLGVKINIMSIILSMISQNGGVAYSDGRKHSSILIKEDETSDDKARIESDNYNKTFVIQNKLLGAFCGLLNFSNKNISEHISQTVENKLQKDVR